MLNKYTTLLILLLLILAINISFYTDYKSDFRIEKSSIPISRMDSSQNDSLNLDFDKIAHLLEDKQIVILGESTHYGGTTFEFKTEFVKYLHQKHGFDVILFEAGLYDTYKIKSDTSLLKEALWNFWYDANQMTNLWNYVGANKDIELAGFDVQLSGLTDDISRAKNIDSILMANNIEIPYIIDSVVPNIKMLMYNGFVLSKGTKKSIIQELRNIGNNLNDQDKHIEAKYFINIADWYECGWKYNWGDAKRFQIRDSLMADNLKFQIDNFYKNKKVIVWASNIHAFNSKESFDNSSISFTPMGERIKEQYGDKVFTLCTTSYSSQNNKSTSFNSGSNRTLEYQLYDNGYKYAFIDLSNVGDKSFMTRLNQRIEYSGKWANSTDAIFFIKTEEEITYKKNSNDE